jgi:D-aminopeptidase
MSEDSSRRARPRARDLGLDFAGTPGTHNALTDVPGVLVGYSTLIEGGGPLVVGQGPVRTGVTAILPRGHAAEPVPVFAGYHALNGNGEMTGTHWIRDGGHFLGPVCLTNTHSVGIAHHASLRWMLDTYAEDFRARHAWAMPVVAETYDGVLNDINGQHVNAEHVRAALDSAAGGSIAEGNVGGGTGMICYEFKGGSGTASRRVELDGENYTVASLVQANYGIRPWLTILGVPVGRHLSAERILPQGELGSIIVVIATDAPMLPHQLQRVARRGTIGIGRCGSPGGNNSGDIFLAFSVANAESLSQRGKSRLSAQYVDDNCFDRFYEATVESVEEAIVNALLAAEDMSTLKLPDDRICRAIPHDRLLEVMRRYGRCA